MSPSILVAFATRYGSTQEVAEVVAATLREHGLKVNIQPMRDVQTLDQYHSIVLGAPLYIFHWHKGALHFLTRHLPTLSTRPVAIFALGPFHADEREFQEARRQLSKEQARFPWLIPAATAVFAVSSIHRSSLSPTISYLASRAHQLATCGTGQPFAPG